METWTTTKFLENLENRNPAPLIFQAYTLVDTDASAFIPDSNTGTFWFLLHHNMMQQIIQQVGIIITVAILVVVPNNTDTNKKLYTSIGVISSDQQ